MKKIFERKDVAFAFVVAAATLTVFSGCQGGHAKTTTADSTKPVAVIKPTPGMAIPYDSSKLYVYLTWDDAPQPPGTNICKNIFETEGVKATFFVVGMNEFGRERAKILDTLRNSYPQFLIANHSYSHGFKNNYKKFYSNPDSAILDFSRAESDMLVPVKIIRLPGNNSWVLKKEIKGPKSTLNVCNKLDTLGYSVIGWDIEWQFKSGNAPVQSADEIINTVNKKFQDYYSNVENNIVILAHDRMFEKPQYQDSLRKVIATLKQNPKIVFETVDHYPGVKH